LYGSPLALTLMGNYLTFQSSIGQPQPLRAALADLLRTMERLHISMPSTPAEPVSYLAETTPSTLHVAIAICDQRQLSQQARATLRALAVFPPKPSSFSEEQALAVSQQSVETLDELWEAGFLESYGPGRYTLHQTIIDYVRTLGEVPAAQEQQANFVQIQQQEAHLSMTTAFPAEDDYRDIYIYQHETHSLRASLSLHLSHWKASLQKEELLTSRPFKRFFPRSLLIASVILLAVVVIISTFTHEHPYPSQLWPSFLHPDDPDRGSLFAKYCPTPPGRFLGRLSPTSQSICP
jgi:hypothetical protein